MSRIAYSLSQLSQVLQLPFEGNPSAPLHLACSLEEPHSQGLAFCEKLSGLKLESSQLGALIADSSPGPAWNVLISPHPRVSFAQALALLYPEVRYPAGVHERAWVDPTAQIHPSARVGPFCWVGPGVVVEEDCQLLAQVSLGPGSHIGRGSQIFPGVSLGHCCRLGQGCVIEPAARLSDHTVLGDRVYVGSRCVLDGCKIGSGSKIDNLAWVGRGADIGECAILVSQCLIEAEARLGAYCLVAAQAVVDRGIELAPKIQVAGRCWVEHDVPTPGVALAGEPAVDYSIEMRSRALRARLGK